LAACLGRPESRRRSVAFCGSTGTVAARYPARNVSASAGCGCVLLNGIRSPRSDAKKGQKLRRSPTIRRCCKPDGLNRVTIQSQGGSKNGPNSR
jgi:hypothetical protein